MYLEMKLKHAELAWRVLKLRFPKSCKSNLFERKQAGYSISFEDLKTKTRYADVFKRQKTRKKLKRRYFQVKD